MAISLSCLHSTFALCYVEIIQQLINVSVSAKDRELLREVFTNWKPIIAVKAKLMPLMNTHPWMKDSCGMWKENGKWGNWQLMNNCPFCQRTIPRIVELSCCDSFHRLIWHTTVIGTSFFSPIHKNRVYINHRWDDDGKIEQYWIQVIECFECGQGLCCAQQHCCRESIMSRFGVHPLGS